MKIEKRLSNRKTEKDAVKGGGGISDTKRRRRYKRQQRKLLRLAQKELAMKEWVRG